jgi:hypothetical protein
VIVAPFPAGSADFEISLASDVDPSGAETFFEAAVEHESETESTANAKKIGRRLRAIAAVRFGQFILYY